MLLDVFDESALSQTVKEEMYKCYPTARLAHLKTGGNFPFLARADEVNVYLQVSNNFFQLNGNYIAVYTFTETCDIEEVFYARFYILGHSPL